MFLCGTSYLVVILRDYRYDTFLKAPEENVEAKIYFDNYIASPVQENVLLFSIGVLFWLKAVIQLKYLSFSGNQFQMINQFLPDLKGFMAIFVVSMIAFAVVGTLIFRGNKDFVDTSAAFMILTSDPLI